MKLVDLNPKWWEENESRFGIVFDCPRCHGKNTDEEKCPQWLRIHIPFSNPITGTSPYKENGWQRVGDTFESLALTPSILAYENRTKDEHWHGFITNGEIITL